MLLEKTNEPANEIFVLIPYKQKSPLKSPMLTYLAMLQVFLVLFHTSCIQVAQWATIAHHGASIMFGDTIYDAQRQITLNLKQ